MSRALNFTRLNAPATLAPAPKSGSGGEGIPEAPQDGQLYGRKDAAWAPVPDPSGDIQALQGRMDTAEGEIDALQTSDTAQGERLDALETSDTAQDERLDALEASDTAQDGRLDALEASDTEQDGKITALEAADTQLGERLTTAEGEIDALQQADTQLDGRLDALETSQGQQDGKIAALEAADTALGERLTTAEGEIDALQASDTAQDGQITDLTGRVEALEQGGGSESGPLMLDMNFVHDVFLIPSSPTSFEQYGQLLAGGLYDQLLAAAESGRPVISGGSTDETAAYPVVYGTSLSDSGLVQLRGIDTGGDSGRQDIVNVTLSRSGTAPDYMYDGLHSVRPGYYSAMTSQPVALSTSAYALNQMDAAGLASMMGGGLFDLLFEAAGEGRFVLMGGASASTEKRPVLYRIQRIGSGTSRSLQLDATDTEGYPTVYAVTLFVNNENGTFSTDGTNIREL